MKKRFLAMLLAGTMVMGMGLTAFAADDEDETQQTIDKSSDLTKDAGIEIKGKAEVQEPTIHVVLPTSFQVVLNPYQVAYTDADGTQKTDQLISAAGYIVNYSDVPIDVTVSEVTATITGDAELAAAAITNETAKKIFLSFDLAKAAYDKSAKGFVASTDTNDAKSIAFKESPVDADKIVLALDKATSSKPSTGKAGSKDPSTDGTVATIDEQTLVKTVDVLQTVDSVRTKTTTTVTPAVAQLKISGSMVATPVDGTDPNPWDDGDEIALSAKFNFAVKANTIATP